MNNAIETKLINYIPKKHRSHIIDLVREGSYIHCVMAWPDGFQRSFIAESVRELKWLVSELEIYRDAQY